MPSARLCKYCGEALEAGSDVVEVRIGPYKFMVSHDRVDWAHGQREFYHKSCFEEHVKGWTD